MKTVHLLIGGRVQGVGFRYFVHQKAKELGITGWVKNTPDGRVEIEASGNNSSQLSTFIDWMKIGPSRAIISTFSESEITNPRNFTDFIIR